MRDLNNHEVVNPRRGSVVSAVVERLETARPMSAHPPTNSPSRQHEQGRRGNIPLRPGLSNVVTRDQCASTQTRFLVKYISAANTIRKIMTRKPTLLRSVIVGSAAQNRNAETSFE